MAQPQHWIQIRCRARDSAEAAHLQELYDKLLREGRKGGGGLAPRSVGHVHRALHNALKRAVVWQVIRSNPASSATKPRVEHEEAEILEPSAVDHVMTVLKGHSVYPIMVLALASGARRGEILGLRWQDVDLDRAEMRIERSVEQTAKAIRIKAPKSRSGRRTVSLPAFAVAELRAHWKKLQEDRLALGLGKSLASDPVFGTSECEVRRPDGLTKEWAKAAKRAGVKASFHALRHTHCSQLIAAGLDPVTIAKRLGHSSPNITLSTYAHLFHDNDDRAVKILDAAFARKE